MGEIAEMMLDGTLCECCGAYIDDGEEFGVSSLLQRGMRQRSRR